MNYPVPGHYQPGLKRLIAIAVTALFAAPLSAFDLTLDLQDAAGRTGAASQLP